MEFTRVDGQDERICLVALCLDSSTLAAVATSWQSDNLPSRWASLIAGWCVKHYQQYKEAPGQAGIIGIYSDWSRGADKESVELVGRLIGSLDPAMLPSTEYSIELIRKVCLRNRARILSEQIQGALSNGKVDEAVALAEEWKRPVIGEQSDGVDLLENTQVQEDAYNNFQPETLVTYKGAIGQFFGPMLSRDSFISFLAPSKRGKSAWLMDVAWMGVLQNRKVVYCSLGDMSQAQTARRFMLKAVRRPPNACEYFIPTKLAYNAKEPVREYQTYSAGCGFDVEAGKLAFRKILEAGQPKRLKLVTKPAGTTSATDISAMIARWADNGWVPDIVVLDYADIMAGPYGAKDLREKINANWTEMRAMSTKYHCLVVTATQADTEGYDSWVLGQRNFNNDRRVHDHVTGMVGINVTPFEKKEHVTRLNWVTLREQESQEGNPGTICAVAGCFTVGCPVIISTWI